MSGHSVTRSQAQRKRNHENANVFSRVIMQPDGFNHSSPRSASPSECLLFTERD